MPKYTYRAVNDAGRPVRGMMDAANEEDLGTKLEQSNLALVDYKVLSEGASKLRGFKSKKVKLRDLIQMFVQMEQLQKAGVPLLESLNDARDSTDSPRLKEIMTDVCKEVSEGTSFSSALTRHPTVFEPIFISLINAGEETGTLPKAFEQVIHHLKWTYEMRRKITKATRYPKILLVVVIGVIFVMMTKVVPQVTDFLKDMGQNLPPVTLALLATSEFFQEYSLYILGGLITFYIGFTTARRVSFRFRYLTDKMFLRAPISGPLIRKISLSSFSRTFGVLFISGLDILKCIDAAKLTATNLVLIESLGIIRERVQEGMPLSEGMKQSGEFPLLVTRMVRIGEESGNLTHVLNQVSEFYDKDVNDAIDGMIQSIEPTLTGILGGLVLWIAAAVFGPIYDSLGSMGK